MQPSLLIARVAEVCSRTIKLLILKFVPTAVYGPRQRRQQAHNSVPSPFYPTHLLFQRLLPAPAPSLAGGQHPDGRGNRMQSSTTACHQPLAGFSRWGSSGEQHILTPLCQRSYPQEADLAVITSYTTSAWMDSVCTLRLKV